MRFTTDVRQEAQLSLW